MFRKITWIAVPAVAIAVTLFANVDSSFAKGGAGMGGHGRVDHGGRRDHRFDRNRFDRYRFGYGYGGYSWGYPSYSYATYPCSACEAPVQAAPVVTAQVCPTCEPAYGVGGGYYRDWGFGHDRRRDRRFDGGKMGQSGHGKK